MDTTTTPAAAGRSLWRQRDFTFLWSAHAVSEFGTQITFFVMPVIAATRLGASAGRVGVLAAAESLPFLLVALPAGVWVDRWDRRRTMIVADVGRMAALAVPPAAYLCGVLTFWVLVAAALVVGLLTVFFDIADQAFLPSAVAAEHIVPGNTALEVSRSVAQLAGPGLGGLLVQAVAGPLVLLFDVGSYLVSVLLLGGIGARPRREPAAPVGPAAPRTRMTAEIGEGLRFVFGDPLLRAIAICTGLLNLVGLGGALSALLTVFALRDLRLTPGELGLMLTLGNVGALLGVFLSSRLVRAFGSGPVLIGSALLCGAPMVLIAAAGTGVSALLVAVSITLTTTGVTIYNVNQLSLRQARTPERLQGRMNASMRFAVWGTLPLGAVLGGVLGDTIGIRPALWTLGVLGFTPCLSLWCTREVRALGVRTP